LGYLGNNALPFDPLRSSGKPVDAQRFNGNGSTTTFTLTYPVTNPTDLEVFVENVQQEPLFAYNATGTQLIFTEAPPSGTNNVYVIYRNIDPGIYTQIPDGAITFNKLANNIRLFTTDNFTGDNTTVAFTLSSAVPDANTLIVAVDGVFQRAPIHYTASGNTITFTSAPPAASNVHVRHLGFRTTQSITALPANTTITQANLESCRTIGQTTFASGTNTAPSITVAGDTNTGVFFPAADTIALTEGGTEVLRITNTANVGIGTTTPRTQVMILGDGQLSSNIVDSGNVGGTLTIASNLNVVNSGGTLMFSARNDAGNYTPQFAIKSLFTNGSGNGTADLVISGRASTGHNYLTEQFRITEIGNLRFNSGYGTAQTAYGCRAWVNFNGTGTVTIRNSGGVSSITDNTTGDYTLNFNFTFPDTNYAIMGSASETGFAYLQHAGTGTRNTTNCRVYGFLTNNGSAYDIASAMFIVFR